MCICEFLNFHVAFETYDLRRPKTLQLYFTLLDSEVQGKIIY